MTKKTIKSIACFVLSMILAVLGSSIMSLSAFAETQTDKQTEYVVTMIGIPQFETTDYDVLKFSLMNNETGKIEYYTLYAYNHFTNKVAMVNGTYEILQIYMENRGNMICRASKTSFEVKGNTNIIFEVINTNYIPESTTDKNQTEQSTVTVPPTSSALIDPFTEATTDKETSSVTTSEPNTTVDVSGSVPGSEITTGSGNTTEPSQTANFTSSSTTGTEETTNVFEHAETASKSFAVIIIAFLFLLIVVVIIVKKKTIG